MNNNTNIMKNTTKILKGLLKVGEVSTDLDRASLEVESTKYYLYAVLDCETNTKDFTFARKTSQDVSAETLDLIPLTPEQETIITNHLQSAFPAETLSEDTISNMDFNYALSIY